MKAILFRLTQKIYRPMDIVEADEYQLSGIDSPNLDFLPLSVCQTLTREVMDKITVDPMKSRVYIVCDLTPRRIACAYMVATGFAELNIPVYLWFTTMNHGVYVSLDDFKAEGHDWAQTFVSRQREQELLARLDS